MVNKITALMVAWVAGVNTRIHQPDKEAEVGGVGEYAALVGLDPIEGVILAALRHREDARRIGAQQNLWRNRRHHTCLAR